VFVFASEDLDGEKGESMEKKTRTSRKEFENFEELTRKLLAVSKKDLGIQKAAYKKKHGKSTKSAE
jgi:hypothetical protein